MNSFVTQLLSLGEILIYSSYIAIFTKDPLVPLPREAEELCSTRRPAVFPLKSRPKWTIIAYLQVTRRKFYARILCFSGVAARASRGFLLGTESTWIHASRARLSCRYFRLVATLVAQRTPLRDSMRDHTFKNLSILPFDPRERHPYTLHPPINYRFYSKQRTKAAEISKEHLTLHLRFRK